ncbi:hypothetical protein K0U83_04715 [bacterium]|nr:hypothetical protein [bacterium]
MRANDRVTVSWPDPGQVDGQFCASLLELMAQRNKRIDGIIRVEGGLLSRQRNEIVKHFLDSTRAAWLLMIDSDEQLPVASFDKLVAAADVDARPVVAGLYFGTWPGGLIPQPIPHLYRRGEDAVAVDPVLDYPPDQLIDVDAAGTGAILIHRRVLAAIRDASDGHEGRDWCWFRDLPVGGRWLGEDLYFCRRIRALGFPIVAHTGAILSHRRRYWLDERQFEAVRTLSEGMAE